jgi:hypothetical protein
MCPKSKRRLIINDGFNPELAEGAKFEGIFQFPIIKPTKEIILPKYLVPFSERNKITNPEKTFVVFYEHDDKFTDLIKHPDKYIVDLSRFAGTISPDNSLYRDTPLACQICNIYRNRLIGSYLQRQGILVIPNLRWGDERTYDKGLFGEAVAFSSAPKCSVVAVGCYGCIRSKENRQYFVEGFFKMLDELEPIAVIVYGKLPENIINLFHAKTKLIIYNDWTSVRHGKHPIYGQW